MSFNISISGSASLSISGSGSGSCSEVEGISVSDRFENVECVERIVVVIVIVAVMVTVSGEVPVVVVGCREGL